MILFSFVAFYYANLQQKSFVFSTASLLISHQQLFDIADQIMHGNIRPSLGLIKFLAPVINERLPDFLVAAGNLMREPMRAEWKSENNFLKFNNINASTAMKEQVQKMEPSERCIISRVIKNATFDSFKENCLDAVNYFNNTQDDNTQQTKFSNNTQDDNAQQTKFSNNTYDREFYDKINKINSIDFNRDINPNDAREIIGDKKGEKFLDETWRLFKTFTFAGLWHIVMRKKPRLGLPGLGN
jgi:hypothetical protein